MDIVVIILIYVLFSLLVLLIDYIKFKKFDSMWDGKPWDEEEYQRRVKQWEKKDGSW